MALSKLSINLVSKKRSKIDGHDSLFAAHCHSQSCEAIENCPKPQVSTCRIGLHHDLFSFVGGT
eukprot:2824044-Pleurochrysis_carterae.AAC.2